MAVLFHVFQIETLVCEDLPLTGGNGGNQKTGESGGTRGQGNQVGTRRQGNMGERRANKHFARLYKILCIVYTNVGNTKGGQYMQHSPTLLFTGKEKWTFAANPLHLNTQT